MGALKIEDVHYTYDDYKLWQGDWELIGGIAIAMPPAPMRKHQSLESTIITELTNQLDNCPLCEVLGEVDYKVSNDTILRPDVVLTCGETNESYLTKAPEVIVEIISKTTAKNDEIYKFKIYETEKVNYYIIVYPDELIAKVYKLDGKEYDKQGDFSIETYEFENTTCKVSLNFERVFRRFR
ncbi:MAG: Uma2 family endonuclease [Epsilonproteobacteria bacterium]|nr:Uma2 family endonuclease [Campylobacterota bacterium]